MIEALSNDWEGGGACWGYVYGLPVRTQREKSEGKSGTGGVCVVERGPAASCSLFFITARWHASGWRLSSVWV